MALTPEEAAELAALEAEFGNTQPSAGLTPEEAAELAQLEAEFSQAPQPQSAPQPKPEPSMGDKAKAALQGFGESMTMGYLPQLQGIGGVAADKVARGLGALGIGPYKSNKELTEAGIQEPETPPTTYLGERDRAIREGKEIAAKAPGYHTAGQVGGFAASIPAGGGIAKLLGGAAKLPQAASFLGGAARGALQGAAYNPGDTEGEIAPLQLGERAQGAALGGALGGALGAVSGKIAEGARRSRVLDKLGSGNYSDELADQIKAAQQGLREKVIAPASQKVDEALAGKRLTIDPRRLEGVDDIVSGYVSRAERDPNQLINIPAKAGRIIKSQAGSQGWRQGAIPTQESIVKKEAMAKIERELSDRLNQLAPEIAPLNKEMSGAYKLSKSLGSMLSSPTTKLKATKEGSKYFDTLKKVDKLTGSKLLETGKDIAAASKALPGEINSLMDLPAEITKLGRRTAGKAARASELATKPLQAVTGSEAPLSEILVRAAIEGKRKEGK